jgi:hypothetical protein
MQRKQRTPIFEIRTRRDQNKKTQEGVRRNQAYALSLCSLLSNETLLMRLSWPMLRHRYQMHTASLELMAHRPRQYSTVQYSTVLHSTAQRYHKQSVERTLSSWRQKRRCTPHTRCDYSPKLPFVTVRPCQGTAAAAALDLPLRPLVHSILPNCLFNASRTQKCRNYAINRYSTVRYCTVSI